jgi:hypothetical protein
MNSLQQLNIGWLDAGKSRSQIAIEYCSPGFQRSGEISYIRQTAVILTSDHRAGMDMQSGFGHQANISTGLIEGARRIRKRLVCSRIRSMQRDEYAKFFRG